MAALFSLIRRLGVISPLSKAPFLSVELETEDVLWTLGSFCALNRKPFDPEMLAKQFPPPYTPDSIIRIARAYGFRVKQSRVSSEEIDKLHFPCLVLVRDMPEDGENNRDASSPEGGAADADLHKPPARTAIVVQSNAEQVVLFKAGTNSPVNFSIAFFADHYLGIAYQLAPKVDAPADPDAARVSEREFGFRWFIPELMRHRKVWRDVLTASFVIQLLALSTPLFTQVIIDKVIVNQTQDTLVVIGVAMVIVALFNAILSWVRQYLVLHTGNRVDAVLGAAVFEHLFKLPLRYFEHRPTGVITARLHGIESIREFVASTAVTLALDLPFLLVFVAIMFYYSVLLAAITLSIIFAIATLSILMAPVFRARLNDQFLLEARNQAFATEYVAGMETVKSLQLEPQIKSRYEDYLAELLSRGFEVRQIANTYNVAANSLEHVMNLLILVVGAFIAMRSRNFTIGMLVAFQMFAARVSQPMLRLVGLWQQFQQAKLSVERLGDIMNAPQEPYTIQPSRTQGGRGQIVIRDLGFSYGDAQPMLYEHFNLSVEPGRVVSIMGPSGSGKSTLTKLLLGFYQPVNGSITLDGQDIRHLSANELRNYFGVVPQETILFSGSVYDNLQMANPHATFDDIVRACRMAEIHDAIEKLPQGYQTEIGERGAGLSGGQKQRIAIARALLKRPRVLLFDEATSSLDAQTSEHFASTINQLKGQMTLLFITHALPKGLQVDDIVHIGNLVDSSGATQSSLGTGTEG